MELDKRKVLREHFENKPCTQRLTRDRSVRGFLRWREWGADDLCVATYVSWCILLNFILHI